LTKYRSLTVMYRIFFHRPCRQRITATYAIFDREHAGVTHANMCEFRGNQRIFTGVIVWTDKQNRLQTDKPKSLTLFNFSWKVLKMAEKNTYKPKLHRILTYEIQIQNIDA
jgi:hypothetical protein